MNSTRSQLAQPGIMAPLPLCSRYITLRLRSGGDVKKSLGRLVDFAAGLDLVVGLGAVTVAVLGRSVDGLRAHPVWSESGVVVPSTPTALWLWLRGDDRGKLLHQGRALVAELADGFEEETVVEGFQYNGGRDLTGYEDGTENPVGEDALLAALLGGSGENLDGSSFVAVQRWTHDLKKFAAKSALERDHTIGRQISDNEEIGDAPKSAHVKRTAQEEFTPEAFVLRRSMPWSEASAHGLVFVAFGHTFDAYEALLRRMVGAEDGIQDALFSFTHPTTGNYFWCPPLKDGRLNLAHLGL